MELLEEFSTLEQSVMSRASERQEPINGSIELLPLCNMHCEMCYVRMDRAEMEAKGRLRTPEEWLAVGEQMQKAGVLFLLLTGGEPLLYPGFRDVYLGLRRMGMFLTINTNGTLIDEEWVAFFRKYPPRRINITIYGTSNEAYEKLCHHPGGFDQVMRGIQLLKEAGLPVKVAQSVTQKNYTDVDRIFDIGEQYDMPVACDTYMMPAARERNCETATEVRLSPEQAAAARVRAFERQMSEEEFALYVKTAVEQVEAVEAKLEEKRKKAHEERNKNLEVHVEEDTKTEDMDLDEDPGRMTCLAGSCSFTINWQGEMRPCVVMTHPAVNVFDAGFEPAWREIRKQVDEIRINPKCTSCPLRSLCRTCAAAALLETGDYLGVPEYLCRYAEETYRLLRLRK